MQSRNKERLLIVLPTLPWPARRDGTALRFAPIIAHLAARYEVDVLVLADPYEPPVVEGPLRQCRDVSVLPVPHLAYPSWLLKLRTVYRGLVPWGLPLGSMRPIAVSALKRWLLAHLEKNQYSTVLWVRFGHLDVACAVRRRYRGGRFVLDMIDSPALIFSREVSLPAHLLPLRRYIIWKWRRMERKVQDTCDATIYISAPDAHAARAHPPATVHTVPNGFFLGDDAPAEPVQRAAGRVIGFLGNMGYRPNISAVLRLATRIFPHVLESLPRASLLVIGRSPPPEVRALQNERVTVTGEVASIWEHVARADVFVFPMIEGAGMQNKILEVMHAGIPVVTTTISAAGIGASDGDQLLIGDTDEQLIAHVLRLLADRELAAGLVARAQAFVHSEFSLGPILSRYEAILTPPVAVPGEARADKPGAPASRYSRT
jgi:glycosyltransferase involved in cell wall biosynthesis